MQSTPESPAAQPPEVIAPATRVNLNRLMDTTMAPQAAIDNTGFIRGHLDGLRTAVTANQRDQVISRLRELRNATNATHLSEALRAQLANMQTELSNVQGEMETTNEGVNRRVEEGWSTITRNTYDRLPNWAKTAALATGATFIIGGIVKVSQWFISLISGSWNLGARGVNGVREHGASVGKSLLKWTLAIGATVGATLGIQAYMNRNNPPNPPPAA